MRQASALSFRTKKSDQSPDHPLHLSFLIIQRMNRKLKLRRNEGLLGVPEEGWSAESSVLICYRNYLLSSSRLCKIRSKSAKPVSSRYSSKSNSFCTASCKFRMVAAKLFASLKPPVIRKCPRFLMIFCNGFRRIWLGEDKIFFWRCPI